MELAVTGPRRVQATLTSERAYENPLWDVAVKGQITAPDGSTRHVDGFWDGGATWRIRFRTDISGRWTVRTTADDSGNTGLHNAHGSLEVRELPAPAHPLDRHGPLRLAENRRHLVHADGTPFLWLADTAWNGVLKAREKDWHHYLAVRREQGFNTVQAVLTQWRAFPDDRLGQRAFYGRERIQVNASFYRRLDPRIEAVADHGLVPALVQLWALTAADPGHWLPEDDAIRLARYQVARYGHLPVVWILGGDGRYVRDEETVERWRRLGRGVFAGHGDPLVTLHPCGRSWIGEAFRDEPWFTFIAYQSGHGSNEDALRWLVEGPPAKEWSNRPQLPVINQEPCYEDHTPYHRQQAFSAFDVRRALYWSLFNAPPAGVTYGHHGIWPWQEVRGVPLAHAKSGTAPPWPEALRAGGARAVTHLKHFFRHVAWWRLEPAPELLAAQPGSKDPQAFVSAVRSRAGDLAVCYLPRGGELALNREVLQDDLTLHRFDPRTGDWTRLGSTGHDGRLKISTPQGQDWLVALGCHRP